MSLLHIGVALALSAGAALIVTGAAMRPIEPGNPARCAHAAAAAAGGSACAKAGGIQVARNVSGGSSLRPDNSRQDGNRRFLRRARASGPDCHRDVRKHHVPGYGVVPHVHIGPDCKVRKAYRSGSG